MSTPTELEKLCTSGNLSKGYWQILVYLWQRHLRGEVANDLQALGIKPGPLDYHLKGLRMRGLVEEHPAGRAWLLSEKARAMFGLPLDPLTAQDPSVPSPAYPFLARDRADQQQALRLWRDENVARDKLLRCVEAWQQNRLNQLPSDLLALCERWALKLDTSREDEP